MRPNRDPLGLRKREEILQLDGKRIIRRQKTAVVIADAIAEDIFARRLSPGTVLATEAQMIAEFGVGRATLREALRLLESEGLVVVRAGPNGGAIVQQPTPHRLARLLSILLSVSGTSLLEVAEARLLVEPELAMRAARNADASDLAALAAVQERQRIAVASDTEDDLAFDDASADFHTIIATASRNSALSAFWFAVSSISDGQQLGVHYGHEPKTASLKAHDKIAEAIRNHNPDEARAAMAKHMTGHIAYLRKAYPDVLEQRVRMVGP
ncbi:MAG: hypothetical protein QOK05_2030 [Chloroflexota bacterium]|jgi:DNA-binding FadR family transcriptional regulator|nr:hypothetical protein [Chloroflexota bacterium]